MNDTDSTTLHDESEKILNNYAVIHTYLLPRLENFG